MPPTKKTYEPIVSIRQNDPTVKIGRCEQILENRMQCWRAGDAVCTEEIPASEEPQSAVRTVKYQICSFHMNLQLAKDKLALAEEEQKPAPAPEVSLASDPAPVQVPSAPTTMTEVDSEKASGVENSTSAPASKVQTPTPISDKKSSS